MIDAKEAIEFYKEQEGNYLFDAEIEHPDPVMLLKHEGVGLLQLDDVTVISGKAKTAKSYCVSILVASLLGCEKFGFESDYYDRNMEVLYFDTEQSESYVARLQRRMHKLLRWDCKENHPSLRIYSLRMMSFETRWKFIMGATLLHHPVVVVVDGLIDLIEDFNDQVASKALLEEMQRFSQANNVATLTVLHENKGKDDKNMQGHLGTILQKKCASVFHLEPKQGLYWVENTDSRDKCVPEWSFAIDSDGMPTTSETRLAEIQEEKEAPKIQKHRDIFEQIFSDGEPRLLQRLKDDFLETHGGSDSTFFNYLKYAKEKGIIVQSGVNYVLCNS